MMGNGEKSTVKEVERRRGTRREESASARCKVRGERRWTRTRAATRKKQKQTSELPTWNADSSSLAAKGSKQPD